jgi:ABC-type cobalamin transport system permease subunit
MIARMAGAAVFVVLLAYFVGRFALTGKGTVNGKLAGILTTLIVLWMIIASKDVGSATSLASYTAGGVTATIGGLTDFLHALFR